MVSTVKTVYIPSHIGEDHAPPPATSSPVISSIENTSTPAVNPENQMSLQDTPNIERLDFVLNHRTSRFIIILDGVVNLSNRFAYLSSVQHELVFMQCNSHVCVCSWMCS